MFNDPPSYRVGEASRANPKGLARLPNSITRKGTSIVDFEISAMAKPYEKKTLKELLEMLFE